MNDRELMEMAAKAADYDVMRTVSGRIVIDFKVWDPLYDDGDAFRLALSLSFDLVFDCYQPKHGDLHRSAFRIRIWAKGWVKEDFDRDGKNAAVRLAIARAAAEIGRCMP